MMPDSFAALLEQCLLDLGLIQKRLAFLALDRTDPRRFVRLQEEIAAHHRFLNSLASKTGVEAPEEVKG